MKLDVSNKTIKMKTRSNQVKRRQEVDTRYKLEMHYFFATEF